MYAKDSYGWLKDSKRSRYEDTVRAFVDERSKKTALMDQQSAREFLKYVDKFDRTRRKPFEVDKIKPLQVTDYPKTEEKPCIEEEMGLEPPTDATDSNEKPYRCLRWKDLPKCPEDLNLTHELLNKLAVLKLNGGLGTRMGCRGPKSAIEVRDDLTFLDLTVRQVEYINTRYGVDIPLILMNSFSTDEQTKTMLSKYEKHNIKFHTFKQHCFPRIDKHTLAPMPTGPMGPDTRDLWYPPGHGNVYRALSDSGLLDKLLQQGIEYIFISNIDNLGATIDLHIFYEIVCTDREICMEVTKRERQDVAGGTIFEYMGKPKLLEQRWVPPREWEKLVSVSSASMFNTNNIWVNLRAMKRQIVHGIESEILVRDVEVKNNTAIQLETAAGSAIQEFEDSLICVVPRKRFFPVKTTDDLFGIQSDVFTVKHGQLFLREERRLLLPVPTVKLGKHFRSVDDYLKRLSHGVPDILELEHLTVSGDVHFGKDVTLKGTVIIVAEEGSHIDIASGSVLKDKVITGNLRIMEH